MTMRVIHGIGYLAAGVVRRRARAVGRAAATLFTVFAAACSSDPVRPGPTAATPLVAAAAAAPSPVWLAPLGTGTAQPGANDDAADISVVVCEASGTACQGPPVAVFRRTPAAGELPLRLDATLGAFAADFDLMRATFLTRRTYHVQLRQGTETLGAVDVDIVRGRWARTVPGSVAPLQSASTLPIRVRVPRAQVRVETPAASPLAAVTVAGLPAGYATTPLAITVAGQTAMLARDVGDTTWTFLLPAGTPAGAATVAFPAVGDFPGQSIQLTVVPTAFVGGSPAATVQTIGRDLADVEAALGRAQLAFSPTNDADIISRLAGVRGLIGQIGPYVDALPEAEREQFAAFYSANRPQFTEVFNLVIALADDAGTAMAPVPSVLLRAPASPALRTTPFGAPSIRMEELTDVVADCEKFVRYMKIFDALENAVSKINAVIQAVAIVPVPHLKAAALVSASVNTMLDIVGIFLNSYPVFLAPAGLQLEFAPARVSPGSGGSMGASVELRSRGGYLGTAVTASLDLVLKKFDFVRGAVISSAELAKRTLTQYGVEDILNKTENLLNDIAAKPISKINTKRRQITLERVAYTFGINGDLWAFTSPSVGVTRSFAANRPGPTRDEIVSQDGEIKGDEPGCSSITSASAPASGINAFTVTKKDTPTPPPPGGGAAGSGSTSGDPHLLTMDGLPYDFQAVGDYILSRSTGAAVDFEVQVRHRRVNSVVSVTDAMAFRVGADVVNVFPATDGSRFDLIINDEVLNGTTALSRKLPGGGTVLVANGTTTVSWPDGTSAKARLYALSLYPLVTRSGALEGLLGNFDGSKANDIRVRNGDVLPSELDARLYTEFRASWRVALGSPTSLFKRGPDLWDPAFPGNRVTLASFSDEEVERARGICRAAGSVTPSVIDGCALDILLTGDNRYATIAANSDPNVLRVSVAPALGYVNANETVQFVAHASSATDPTVTWTATGGTITESGPNTITYTAPGTPGQYTITAVSKQNGTATGRAVVNVGTLGTLVLNGGTGIRVGTGLRSSCQPIVLPVPLPAARTATVTSGDGTILQVASNPDCGTTVGTPGTTESIPLAAGATRLYFLADALEGKTGPVTVSVAVPGYTTYNLPFVVAPAALTWIDYPRVPTTTETVVYYPLRVGVGVETGPGTGAVVVQSIRPGGVPLTVRATSPFDYRAQIATPGGPGAASGTAVIAAGESSTPASGAGSLSMIVKSIGTAALEATTVGTPSALAAAPVYPQIVGRRFAFYNSGTGVTIGVPSGTEYGYFALQTIFEPTPVTLTSSSGDRLHVAFDLNCDGKSLGPAGVSATLTLPTGSTRFCFVVYGRGVGYTELTATSPGYSSATRSFIVTPPAANRAAVSGSPPP